VNSYDNYAQFNIGRMDKACSSCGALKWAGKAPGMCCSGGKVNLTALQPPPEPLESLMSGTTPRSKHFLENIRKYNSCFQMTSFGATKEICEPGFMPTFKVQGQVYHRVGSLLPLADGEHKFLQIYFMGDEQKEARQRCSNIPGTNRNIVRELQQMLHEHHSYVQIFKTALQRMPTDAYKVVIRADATPAGEHERRYNAPTTNEVAIVIVGDGFDRRDIILEKRNNQLQSVSDTHRSYDALQYPLIFWKGEHGYHFHIILFFFCALIFGCVFQFVLLLSNQFLSSLIEPTIERVKNAREMGKAEKLSPPPTYSKSGSKRSKMTVKTVRRTDRNATKQHASESTAMKMDGTVETN
jgi:hypothetical protein